MGPRLVAWIERTLEQDLRLTVNRAKTRVVRVTASQQSLDFLGFTLRICRDRSGRGHCAIWRSVHRRGRKRECGRKCES